MNKKTFFKIVTLSIIVLAACDFSFSFGSTATPAPPTATTASAFPWPDEAGECTLVTSVMAPVYARPSDQADVFAEVGAGFETVVTTRTVDGWAGFDPGVAQAANIGIFRSRWIFFEDASFSGGCLSLPEESWTPDPVACYTMPMESVQVHADADVTSDVLAALEIQDFAAVLGLTSDGWAQVDLGLGNTGLTGIGWMDQAALNLNGSACSSLPSVSP